MNQVTGAVGGHSSQQPQGFDLMIPPSRRQINQGSNNDQNSSDNAQISFPVAAEREVRLNNLVPRPPREPRDPEIDFLEINEGEIPYLEINEIELGRQDANNPHD